MANMLRPAVLINSNKITVVTTNANTLALHKWQVVENHHALKQVFKKKASVRPCLDNILSKKYSAYISMHFALAKAGNAHAVIVIGAGGKEVLIHSCTHE